MIYCKNYCEEKGISTSKLNEAQRTLHYIAENMRMEKKISEDGYKHFQQAIKALEQEPYDFAKWVASEIFDDMWEYNKYSFAEIACRKLAKLGIVRAKSNEWELVEQEPLEVEATKLQQAYNKGFGDCKQVVLELLADYDLSMGQVVKGVHDLSPVTPQPKTGHWIFDDECKEHGHCSHCGYGSVDLVDGKSHNFCRNCGAWMIESQESEDKNEIIYIHI